MVPRARRLFSLVAVLAAASAAVAADASRWVVPDSPGRPHPRLLFTADEIRALRADPAVVDEARRVAEPFLAKTRTVSWPDYAMPLPEVKMPPRHAGYGWPYWTPLGVELRRDLEAMSWGYAMTADARFLERARALMRSIAALPAWTDPDYEAGVNPCLDTFYITCGMSIAYDLLYDALPAAEREAVRDAILERGVRFTASRANDPTSFVNAPHRWPNGFAMVIAGMGTGALAVWGDAPGAADALRLAIERAGQFMTVEARPDGGLVEGFFYGAASVDPLALFFRAVKRTAGIDLFTFPYFQHAHEYPLLFLIPGSGWLAGFGDNGGPEGTQPLFQGTISVLDEMGLADGRALWYYQGALKTPEVKPTYLKMIQQGMFDALRRTFPGRNVRAASVLTRPSIPPDPGPAAGAVKSIGWAALRSGYGPDDSLLAFRCGDVIGHSHLDQNNFVLAARGRMLAGDPGYQRFDLPYPGEPDVAFSHREHLFTYESIGHSVVLVDGEGQVKAPGTMSGPFDSPAASWVEGEAAPAYPTLRSFARRVVHLKAAGVYVVSDRIATDGKSRKIDWLLQAGPRSSFAAGGALEPGRTAASREVAIVNEGAALTATFPLGGVPSWTRREPADMRHLGKTIGTSSTGAAVRSLAVLEPHAAGTAPAVRVAARDAADGSGFVLEASRPGAGTVRMMENPEGGGRSADGVSTDGRFAVWTTAESGRVSSWAVSRGMLLVVGAEATAASTVPMDIGAVEDAGGLSVSTFADAPAVLTLRVPSFVSLEVDGGPVAAEDYRFDPAAKTLRVRLVAGAHALRVTAR